MSCGAWRVARRTLSSLDHCRDRRHRRVGTCGDHEGSAVIAAVRVVRRGWRDGRSGSRKLLQILEDRPDYSLCSVDIWRAIGRRATATRGAMPGAMPWAKSTHSPSVFASPNCSISEEIVRTSHRHTSVPADALSPMFTSEFAICPEHILWVGAPGRARNRSRRAKRVAALPDGRRGAAPSRSEEARPAGLEPATPGLEG